MSEDELKKILDEIMKKSLNVFSISLSSTSCNELDRHAEFRMKHIYLHTSNLDHTEIFRNEQNFEPPHEYNKLNFYQTFPNEYGLLRYKNFCIHLMMGRIKQEFCPWCGGVVKLRKIKYSTNLTPFQCSMCCERCGSQGPVLNVNPIIEEDEDMIKEVEDLIRDRYSHRISWDYGLVNPYEGGESSPPK